MGAISVGIGICLSVWHINVFVGSVFRRSDLSNLGLGLRNRGLAQWFLDVFLHRRGH
jgi:hypothetical protein